MHMMLVPKCIMWKETTEVWRLADIVSWQDVDNTYIDSQSL